MALRASLQNIGKSEASASRPFDELVVEALDANQLLDTAGRVIPGQCLGPADVSFTIDLLRKAAGWGVDVKKKRRIGRKKAKQALNCVGGGMGAVLATLAHDSSLMQTVVLSLISHPQPVGSLANSTDHTRAAWNEYLKRIPKDKVDKTTDDITRFLDVVSNVVVEVDVIHSTLKDLNKIVPNRRALIDRLRPALTEVATLFSGVAVESLESRLKDLFTVLQQNLNNEAQLLDSWTYVTAEGKSSTGLLRCLYKEVYQTSLSGKCKSADPLLETFFQRHSYLRDKDGFMLAGYSLSTELDIRYFAAFVVFADEHQEKKGMFDRMKKSKKEEDTKPAAHPSYRPLLCAVHPDQIEYLLHLIMSDGTDEARMRGLRVLDHYIAARRQHPSLPLPPDAILLRGTFRDIHLDEDTDPSHTNLVEFARAIHRDVCRISAMQGLGVAPPGYLMQGSLHASQFGLILFDFEAQANVELSAKKNEVVMVLEEKDNGWIKCKNGESVVGLVPKDYLKLGGNAYELIVQRINQAVTHEDFAFVPQELESFVALMETLISELVETKVPSLGEYWTQILDYQMLADTSQHILERGGFFAGLKPEELEHRNMVEDLLALRAMISLIIVQLYSEQGEDGVVQGFPHLRRLRQLPGFSFLEQTAIRIGLIHPVDPCEEAEYYGYDDQYLTDAALVNLFMMLSQNKMLLNFLAPSSKDQADIQYAFIFNDAVANLSKLKGRFRSILGKVSAMEEIISPLSPEEQEEMIKDLLGVREHWDEMVGEAVDNHAMIATLNSNKATIQEQLSLTPDEIEERIEELGSFLESLTRTRPVMDANMFTLLLGIVFSTIVKRIKETEVAGFIEASLPILEGAYVLALQATGTVRTCDSEDDKVLATLRAVCGVADAKAAHFLERTMDAAYGITNDVRFFACLFCIVCTMRQGERGHGVLTRSALELWWHGASNSSLLLDERVAEMSRTAEEWLYNICDQATSLAACRKFARMMKDGFHLEARNEAIGAVEAMNQHIQRSQKRERDYEKRRMQLKTLARHCKEKRAVREKNIENPPDFKEAMLGLAPASVEKALGEVKRLANEERRNDTLSHHHARQKARDALTKIASCGGTAEELWEDSSVVLTDALNVAAKFLENCKTECEGFTGKSRRSLISLETLRENLRTNQLVAYQAFLSATGVPERGPLVEAAYHAFTGAPVEDSDDPRTVEPKWPLAETGERPMGWTDMVASIIGVTQKEVFSGSQARIRQILDNLGAGVMQPHLAAQHAWLWDLPAPEVVATQIIEEAKKDEGSKKNKKRRQSSPNAIWGVGERTIEAVLIRLELCLDGVLQCCDTMKGVPSVGPPFARHYYEMVEEVENVKQQYMQVYYRATGIPAANVMARQEMLAPPLLLGFSGLGGKNAAKAGFRRVIKTGLRALMPTEDWASTLGRCDAPLDHITQGGLALEGGAVKFEANPPPLGLSLAADHLFRVMCKLTPPPFMPVKVKRASDSLMTVATCHGRGELPLRDLVRIHPEMLPHICDDNFSRWVIGSLLTDPIDATVDRLQVKLIDSGKPQLSVELVMDTPALRHFSVDGQQASCCNYLYTMAQMQHKVPDTVKATFMSKAAECMVLDWLKELLFEDERIEVLRSYNVFSEIELSDASLPMRIPARTVERVYQKLRALQDVLSSDPDATNCTLLRVLEPQLAAVYEPALQQFSNRDEAFAAITEAMDPAPVESERPSSMTTTMALEEFLVAVDCQLLDGALQAAVFSQLQRRIYSGLGVLTIVGSSVVDDGLLRDLLINFPNLKRLRLLRNKCDGLTGEGLLSIIMASSSSIEFLEVSMGSIEADVAARIGRETKLILVPDGAGASIDEVTADHAVAPAVLDVDDIRAQIDDLQRQLQNIDGSTPEGKAEFVALRKRRMALQDELLKAEGGV